MQEIGIRQEITDVKERITPLLILVGLFALLLGGVVYIIDRPPERIYFLHETFSLYVHGQHHFGVIGNSLPTFAHVFALILITAGLLSVRKRNLIYVSVSWFVIDLAFEIGQHPVAATRILPIIPDWFRQIPLLENVPSYFIHGTFDILDVVSIILGAVAAYFASRGCIS